MADRARTAIAISLIALTARLLRGEAPPSGKRGIRMSKGADLLSSACAAVGASKLLV